MNKLLISYDLIGNEGYDDYKVLINYIKTYTCVKVLRSQWLIKTSKTTNSIRDEIKKYVDNNDKVFVVKISSTWASYNLPKKAIDLLKD